MLGKDVDDNKWFFTFVDEVKKLKIVSGYTDLKGNPTGEFGPSNLTTVAEALKMALESSGYGQSISNGRPQNKKAENHWAMKYYLKAEELKLDIIKNILDDPNRPITREEFVKLQLEVFKITPLTTYSPIFSDIDEKSDFSGFIYRAYQDGVISGDSEKNTFRPRDNINRAELAKVLVQSINTYKK